MSTYTLQPGSNGQDIWITNVFSYDSNYGVDDAWLKVGGWGDYYYSLIKFDLSSVAFVGNDVTSATLRLYSNPYTDYTPTGMYVDQLGTAWTDAYGWYDYPLSYTNESTVPTPPTTGWVDIDVTSLAKNWLADPNSNFGLQLRPVGNNHNLDYFVASEATGDMAAYRPELVITYTDPGLVAVPEPSAAIIFATASLLLLATRALRVRSSY